MVDSLLLLRELVLTGTKLFSKVLLGATVGATVGTTRLLLLLDFVPDLLECLDDMILAGRETRVGDVSVALYWS